MKKNAVDELNRNWVMARRAMMRNPIDRIGFAGYLELAAKFPKFIARAGQVCDEFRYIYDMNSEAQELVLKPYEIKWIIV